jgi:hypothetical protein
MNYIFWIIIGLAVGLAIYWIVDWESHFRDEDHGK